MGDNGTVSSGRPLLGSAYITWVALSPVNCAGETGGIWVQGLVCVPPYALCVGVMLGREFRGKPAYKLMLAMAVVDFMQAPSK